MCGIAGYFGSGEKVTLEKLKLMSDTLKHRGPDGDGFFINKESNLGFAHRRLSIIDLTANGKQPMSFDYGRYTITYNGEIYNYVEIRDSLMKQGFIFKTDTDTEILLALYSLKKEKCLKELDGMFAFCIYDNKTNSVFMARDRFGEKPLYYSYHKNNIYFASEIKALFKAGIQKKNNEDRIYSYLALNKFNDESNLNSTFYDGIFQLEPATFIIFHENKIQTKSKYWNINLQNINNTITEQEACFQFKSLLINSVKIRMRSDVAIGSSLSGGLDSSTIVYILEDQLKGNTLQKTFSARFENFKKDEGYFINLVLERSPHIQGFNVYPTSEGFMEDIEKLIYHQEEPFFSASQYNQYCVMKLAMENNVTVLLDGQGADELMGGYLHYYFHYLTRLSFTNPKKYYAEYKNFQKVHKISSPFRLPRRLPFWLIKKYATGNKFKYDTDVRELMINDSTEAHLQNLLNFGDKNSMAFSREVRLPFLSHHLVEFIFTLPTNLLLNGGWTKYILRKSFENNIPNEITWRKDKIGFEPPQEKWMESIRPQLDEFKKRTNYLDFTNGKKVDQIDDWKWLMIKNYFI